MFSCRRCFSLAALTGCVAVFNLGGCGPSGTTQSNGPASTIVISPAPASMSAGSSQMFTAVTTYASAVTWGLEGTNAGMLSSTTGFNVNYTAPATPPVYLTGSGLTQGTVYLQAETTGVNACGDAYQTLSFVVTAPSVTAGISPATASVALGGTQTFIAYAVGSVNGGITVQVDGVTGGSTASGTIALLPSYNTSGAYTYTAPTAMPMTGNTVTIKVTSIADPTKSASSVVTLH